MRVELGPVSSASALAWLDFAESVVARVERGEGPGGITLPSDVLDAFHDYLQQWRKAAEAGPVFRWAGEGDTEVVEYLLNAWYRLATSVADEAGGRGGRAPRPPGSEEFADHLLDVVLVALAAEGRSRQEFADHLRAFWPGHQGGA